MRREQGSFEGVSGSRCHSNGNGDVAVSSAVVSLSSSSSFFSIFSLLVGMLQFKKFDLSLPRTSRISCPKIAIFSQFQVHLGIYSDKTNNKFILNNFYPAISYLPVRNEFVWSLVMVRESVANASG